MIYEQEPMGLCSCVFSLYKLYSGARKVFIYLKKIDRAMCSWIYKWCLLRRIIIAVSHLSNTCWFVPLFSFFEMSIVIQAISLLCVFAKSVIFELPGKVSEYLGGYQLTAEYFRPIILYGKAELIWSPPKDSLLPCTAGKIALNLRKYKKLEDL